MKSLSLMGAAALAAAVLVPVTATARQADTPPVVAAPPALPPPTQAEIAAANAEADAVIARLGVGDLFENVTDSNVPTIRHKASGLLCNFDPGTELSIQIYDGLPRGDDVSCGATTLGITETLYATRYPQRPTALQIVQSSLVAIRQNFKNVKDYTGTAVSMQEPDADAPKVVTARLTAKLGGKPVFTRSSAVMVGDWIYAQRVTGPVDKALMADILAEMSITLLILKLAPPPPQAPNAGTATPTSPAAAGQPGS